MSLEEECDEWYLGMAQSDPSIVGVFPKSVIHMYTTGFFGEWPILTEIGILS